MRILPTGKDGLATQLVQEIKYFQEEKRRIRKEPHSPSRGNSLSEAHTRIFLAQQLLEEVNSKPKKEV